MQSKSDKSDAAFVVMHVLTSPSVLEDINRRGYQINWEEVIGFFTKAPVISKPKSNTKTARKGGKEKQ